MDTLCPGPDRADADGVALSFCDVSEREVLHSIQRLTKQTLAVDALAKALPAPSPAAAKPAAAKAKTGPALRPFSHSGKAKRPGKQRRPATSRW